MSPGLPILTYHDFDPSESVLATDPSRFGDTMAILHGAGYRTVDLDAWVAEGRPAVERGFALAFDDGLRSVLDVVEALARYGFRATAFLVTGRMGQDNQWPGQPSWVPRRALLDWSDLPALRDAGISIAAHTRTHPDLRRLDDRRLADELRGSRQDIEDRTVHPCPLLAYPYGAEDGRVRRVAAREYVASFGTRLGLAAPGENPHAISRVDAYYLRTPGAVASLVAGRLEQSLRWRRVARRVRSNLDPSMAMAGRGAT